MFLIGLQRWNEVQNSGPCSFMAKWSILSDGSAVDAVGTDIPCKTNGPSREANRHSIKDRVADDSKIEFLDKLRSTFYKVLSVFLKEITNQACIHPVLTKLGDGRLVDLFNLYCMVRRRGGYEIITKKGEWGSVTREFDFDYGATASLKLMHSKYLNGFDLWLKGRCGDMCVGNEKCELDLNFAAMALELEMGFRSLLSDGTEDRLRKSSRECVIVKNKSSKSHELDSNGECKFNCKVEIDDDEKNIDAGDGNRAILTTKTPEIKSQKRKRESFQRMLSWLVDVAKHPDDPAIGAIPEPSKLGEHSRKELWMQAILARDALCQRKQFGSQSEEYASEKKLRMHPSMYEDNFFNHPYSERLRCRENRTLVKSPLCSASQSEGICTERQSKNCTEDQMLGRLAVFADCTGNQTKLAEESAKDVFNMSSSLLDEEQNQNHSSIGPLFQAEVPEWTGIVSESDSKWLGTGVWPLKMDGYICSDEMEYLGKGRPDSCSCFLPGSVECVRFHIVENRLKLKLELGSVFYRWKFNHMGEEVSLLWTVEEERTFKDIVRANTPLRNKCFMDVVSRYFPKKSRENLVSYYCNAFLLRRRRYQNRVTPKEIDSDDDDSEFGSFGDTLQIKLAHVPNCLPCGENRQCTDLDINDNPD